MLFYAIDAFLKKLGSAFGFIFKILIPALLFYYPFKVLTFAAILLSAKFGLPTSWAGNYQTIYIVAYICFIFVLIFLPKVASAIEFVLMPLYLFAVDFQYRVLFQVQFYSLDFSQNIFEINMNRICVVALVIFIIFKILFHIYLNRNIDRIYELEMDEYI